MNVSVISMRYVAGLGWERQNIACSHILYESFDPYTLVSTDIYPVRGQVSIILSSFEFFPRCVVALLALALTHCSYKWQFFEDGGPGGDDETVSRREWGPQNSGIYLISRDTSLDHHDCTPVCENEDNPEPRVGCKCSNVRPENKRNINDIRTTWWSSPWYW